MIQKFVNLFTDFLYMILMSVCFQHQINCDDDDDNEFKEEKNKHNSYKISPLTDLYFDNKNDAPSKLIKLLTDAEYLVKRNKALESESPPSSRYSTEKSGSDLGLGLQLGLESGLEAGLESLLDSSLFSSSSFNEREAKIGPLINDIIPLRYFRPIKKLLIRRLYNHIRRNPIKKIRRKLIMRALRRTMRMGAIPLAFRMAGKLILYNIFLLIIYKIKLISFKIS